MVQSNNSSVVDIWRFLLEYRYLYSEAMHLFACQLLLIGRITFKFSNSLIDFIVLTFLMCRDLITLSAIFQIILVIARGIVEIFN